MTGTKSDRPQWLKLMKKVKPGDEILVTKLDRLGRSLRIILNEIDELTAKQVSVTVGNMTFDKSTPTGKLMLNVMASFAEFERDMIVDRMQGGRAYKRKTDPKYREGRKRRLTPAMVHAMREYYKPILKKKQQRLLIFHREQLVTIWENLVNKTNYFHQHNKSLTILEISKHSQAFVNLKIKSYSWSSGIS